MNLAECDIRSRLSHFHRSIRQLFMAEDNLLAKQFEENRGYLRGVAYRMLGSSAEADDAIQETWLRLTRAGSGEIENLRGWLSTVIARICLDMLRARTARRENAIDKQDVTPEPAATSTMNPEQEVLLADSVGVALLVIIDQLSPAERLAFVMHDMFDMSFDEIAGIIGRTPAATRQLASRARRRVQGTKPAAAGLPAQRKVVDAFLAALRQGDFEGLLGVLDPDVVVHIHDAKPREIRGARTWAQGAIAFSRMLGPAPVEVALVDGKIGMVVARRGRLFRALQFSIVENKIAEVQIFVSPASVKALSISTLDKE